MIYVYCEGQTEESFVNEVLAPYMLQNAGLYLKPIICQTKRTPQKKYKGGIVNYSKAKKEIQRLCKEHHNEFITTIIDFYAFPEDAPGMDQIQDKTDVYERVGHVESAIFNDIDCNNFIPNLMLHEFEALLFVKPELFSLYYQNHDIAIERLIAERNKAETPEHIDLGKKTAPSKRILSAIPGYDKSTAGTVIALDIGIDSILSECKHFAEWINKLYLLK